MFRMSRTIILLVLLALSLGLLSAQNTLQVNGLNEAKFIYRTVPDSLNAYFRDSFSFNMGYRNFSFGMKFIAELPKYSTSQSDLLDELSPERLSLGWKELYVSYAKDAYLVHAGTIEETFGNGTVFRSFQDIEFDRDNRVTGFKFGYDDVLRVKALYAGITSPGTTDKLDIVYGMDAEYPVLGELTLGASAVAMRNLTAFNTYSQNDVFGGRLKFQSGVFDLSAEYSQRELYHRGMGLAPVSGTAMYANTALMFEPVQVGAVYKSYDKFQYLLQDLPLANYHNETLADSQSSGTDEEGFQGWANFSFINNIGIYVDYAEAWSSAQDMKMNDAYGAVEWEKGSLLATVSYSHVEKVNDALSQWQKEVYPGFHLSFPAGKTNMVLAGELKMVTKQSFAVETSHFEPKLQADISMGKLGLSVAGGSWMEELSAVMESRYWANMEVKYPILDGTELVLFGGKEPGGKVCRNGVCRYVAPFSGLRLELSTRF